MYAEVLEVYEENGTLKVRLEGNYRGKLISQIYKVSDVLPPTQPNNLGVVLWGVFDGDKLLAAHPTRKQARCIAKVYGFKTKELRLCVTHGIFSAGLQPLECYDKIYAAYSRLDTELIDQFNTRKERNA